MQTATSCALDAEQGKALSAAFDFAWRRLLQTDLLQPSQYAQMQNILTTYLIKLVRRGERNEGRLARRGIFFVCGLLAAPDPVSFTGRALYFAEGAAGVVF